MLTVVPFREAHLKALQLQEAQAYLEPIMRQPGYGQTFAEAGPAYTALVDGRVVGCLGVAELWEGRGAAWALLARDRPAHFLAVHRAVKAFLDGYQLRRVEAYVDVGFEEAHRWMRLLNFRLETPEPMRSFAEDRDMYMYARVRRHG